MNTNVNLEEAVGVLAFLGTAFVLGLGLIVVLHAVKTRKHARAKRISLALKTHLRSCESYTTDLVFNLLTNIANHQLLMHEGEFITHFIIGHENSFRHRRTKFRLES